MKTILATVSAIGLLAAAPAYAADAPEVNISGNVAEACGYGDHISGGNVDPQDIFHQGDVALGAMTGADGKLNVDASKLSNRSFGNVWCNTAGKVTVTVESLANDDATRGVAYVGDSSSFTDQFDLLITSNTFLANGSVLNLSSANGANGVNSADFTTTGAFETGHGKYSGFSVEILNPDHKRPISGDYAGKVTLTATVS